MSKEIAKTVESILNAVSFISCDLSLLSILYNAKMTPVDVALHVNNVPVLCVFLDVCTNRLGGVVKDTSHPDHKIPNMVVDKIREHFRQHEQHLISLFKNSSQIMLIAYKENEKLTADLQQKTKELEELKKVLKSK